MTEPTPRPMIPGLRTLIEDVFGIQVDDAMEEGLNVENAEGARAAWIRAHPDRFRG